MYGWKDKVPFKAVKWDGGPFLLWAPKGKPSVDRAGDSRGTLGLSQDIPYQEAKTLFPEILWLQELWPRSSLAWAQT